MFSRNPGEWPDEGEIESTTSTPDVLGAPVIKQTLTATSFLLGTAGAIFVVYLATHPLALTRPTDPSPVPATPSQHTELASAKGGESAVSFTVPEITIVASLERKSRSPGPTAALEPCSGWSEVGALFIEPGGAVGARGVRHLCQTAR
jgi:hypothetical protein